MNDDGGGPGGIHRGRLMATTSPLGGRIAQDLGSWSARPAAGAADAAGGKAASKRYRLTPNFPQGGSSGPASEEIGAHVWA